tara:strand:- start:275 stop:1414 length:1140 start_codon:yes stop_codon:yes gene_type:complete
VKVVRVCTVPLSLVGYTSHLEELVRNGVELVIITSQDEYFDKLKSSSYKVIPLTIKRNISPLHDVVSIFKLILLLRKEKPDIVHSNTPKAGLISALAGLFSGVAVHLHTFTGQVWANYTGLKRQFFILIDRVIIQLNHAAIADSKSQAIFLEKETNLSNRVKCLGDGSFGGIDISKCITKHTDSEVRQELGIGKDDFVLLYLGRVVKDKGIEELLDSYLQLKEKSESIKLLIVGPIEKSKNKISDIHLKILNNTPGVYTVGFTSETQRYYSACDILVLPSYREGFGTVVLEAGAFRKPTVGSRIYGVSDAIEDEKTGLLCEVGSSVDLTQKIERCFNDREFVAQMGEKSFARVKAKFDYKVVAKNLVSFYRRCLNEKGL